MGVSHRRTAVLAYIMALLMLADPSAARPQLGQPSMLAQLATVQRPAGLVRDIETSSNVAPQITLFGNEALIEYGEPAPLVQSEGFYRYLSDGTPSGTRNASESELLGVKSCGPDQNQAIPLGNRMLRCFKEATTGIYGLWSTDGRIEGSTLLVNTIQSWPPLVVGAQVMFFTYDPSNPAIGLQLWRSDGTVAGSRPVDPNMPRFSTIYKPAVASDQVLFIGITEGGTALWRSGGSPESTAKIFELEQGDPYATYSALVVTGEQTFFIRSPSCERLCSPRELYVSDGTTAGTRLVLSSLTLIDDTLLSLGDRAVFETVGEGTGRNVWVSDGTESGTQQITTTPDFFHEELVIGDQLYIFTSGGLLRSDGTAAGTELIDPASNNVSSRVVATLDRQLIYGGCTFDGCSLRMLEPGAAGPTVLVERISRDFADPYQLAMLELNDLVLFQLCTASSGCEPWRSDGTVAGTYMLGDVNPGAAPSAFTNQIYFYQVGDRALMILTDGVHGPQVWTSDGSKSGTQELVRVSPLINGSSSPYFGAALDERAIFSVNNALKSEIWSSDGSAEGTLRIDNLISTSLGQSLAVAGGKIFYTGASDRYGVYPDQVLASDGVRPGTPIFTVTVSINQRDMLFNPSPSHLTAVGSQVFFSACEAAGRCKLYVSDGTAAGTRAIVDLRNHPQQIFAGDGQAFVWIASSDASRYTLLVSEGTAAGSRELASFPAYMPPDNLSRAPKFFATIGEQTIFAAGDPADEAAPYRLFTSDGTAVGTLPISGSFGNSAPFASALIDEVLFFSLDTTLWRSNGTAGGTTQIIDLGAPLTHIIGDAKRVFVTAGSPLRQLWISDGTAAGTRRTVGLPEGFAANPLCVIDGVLLSSGQRLWRSDGTPTGTYPIQNLESYNALRVGDRIFLAGNDRLTGSEPWVIQAGAYLTGSASGGAAPGGTHLLSTTVGETWQPETGLAASGIMTLSVDLDPRLGYLDNDAGLTPVTISPTLSFALPRSEQPFTMRQIGLRLAVPDAAPGTNLLVQVSLTAPGDPAPGDNSLSGTIRLGRLLYLPMQRRE